MFDNKLDIVKIIFLFSFVGYCMCTGNDATYLNPPILATHPDGANYVGSLTCKECHQSIYEDHIESAHHLTSEIANSTNIEGSVKKGKNTLKLSGGEFTMIQEGKSYFQLTLANDGPSVRKQQVDIVVGSGVKGKSFLTWHEDQLYQLQVSYNTPNDQWINSPGFPKHPLDRPIRDACLKCHMTHATNKDFSGSGNRYDQAQMIYGIDCERCHGPSEKHVTFHRSNPDVSKAQYILRVDTFPQQQRLDLCAQCHSGPRDNIIQGNSFSYLPGKILKEYSRNYYTGRPSTELDVHGNQYGLLTSSKCFLESSQMDCGSCHDPHVKQRGNTDHFINKCNSCHQGPDHHCSASPEDLQSMDNNCIACHMPNKPSKMMSMQGFEEGVETPVLVRTHLIGIYGREEWLP